MKTEYCILVENDWVYLERKVNEQLQAGWQLQGGVCLAIDESNNKRWAQAMIRVIPVPTKKVEIE